MLTDTGTDVALLGGSELPVSTGSGLTDRALFLGKTELLLLDDCNTGINVGYTFTDHTHSADLPQPSK